MRNPSTFYVKTYGCQMNELDSEIMIGQLEQRGMHRIDDEETADLLIFNTCSIRDLAERKVMGKVGRMAKPNYRKHHRPLIGITGCMANAKKEKLFQKLPHIDFVLGTNNIHDLNNVLDEVLSSGTKVFRTADNFTHELDYQSAKRDDKLKAHISIIRGCDKFCTYCVVPYTRGPEVSRDPESIVLECQKLALEGYKEITLLGQNVNSYGKDKPEWNALFHDLLYRLNDIDGIERIHFMTSHPVDITRELMEAIRDLPKVCEFVHFPLQAGSNRILRKMHRIYTLEQYLEKVAMLREIVPNVALGTDIIVGFPTETDAEFEETRRMLEEIKYDTLFAFGYSQRQGTPAARWVDDVPEEIKQERLQILLKQQGGIDAAIRQKLLNTEMEILITEVSDRQPGFVKGRTRCWKNAILPGDNSMIGTLKKITINGYSNQTLLGA